MSGPTVPSRKKGRPIRELHVRLQRDGGGGELRSFQPITVGTADGNSLVVGDPTVSRYHLEVSRYADKIRVRDLSSTNGTQIGSVVLDGSHALVAPGTEMTLALSVRCDSGQPLRTISAPTNVPSADSNST